MAIVLTAQDAARMHEINRIVRQQLESKLQELRLRGSLIPPRPYLAKTDGTGITAASGTTAGKGTVTLQKVDTDTDLMASRTDASGNAITKTAYNFVETASGTSTYVFVVQDVDGVFWYVAEAC